MSRRKKPPNPKPEILVIAHDPEIRKILAGLVPQNILTREVEPAELENAADHVDLCGAIALLDGTAGEHEIAELEALQLMRAGRALILVLRDVSDRLLELAISRLGPADLIPYREATTVLR